MRVSDMFVLWVLCTVLAFLMFGCAVRYDPMPKRQGYQLEINDDRRTTDRAGSY